MIYQLIDRHDDAVPACVAERFAIRTLQVDEVLQAGLRAWPIQPEDILINRLTDFRLRDRQQYAALSFFIQRFPCILARPGLYDLADDCLPLPVQWNLVRASKAVTVPQHHFSVKFDSSSSFAGDLKIDPFDFYRWSPQQDSAPNGTWNLLQVKAPEGRGIVLSLMGPLAEYAWLDSMERVQAQDLRTALDAACRDIRSIIPYSFGEILLFHGPDGLVFWMISNRAVLSSQAPFREELWSAGLSALLEEFHA